MEKSNNSPQEIWDAIKKANNPLICMDSRFDFDALCSSKALQYVIKEFLNKEVEIIYAKSIDSSVSKLIDFSNIKTNTDIKDYDLASYDLLIFADSGGANHISYDSLYILPEDKLKINIDHHSSNELFGDLNYVFSLASTCSVLYQLFEELKLNIDKDLARMLLLGLLTDSGFFQYKTVTPQDLRTSASLIEKGADLNELVWSVTFNQTLDDIKFTSLVYANLKVDFSKKYAFSTLTLKELEGINMENVTVTHSDLIRKLKGVDFVFVVREKGESNYSFSFRSSALGFDVATLAAKFKGGGHEGSAGGLLRGFANINEAVEYVQKTLNL